MFRSATVLSRRWAAQGVVTCSRSFSVKKKKTIQDLAKEVSLRGKPVLVRADLNLPRSKEDGSITDDTRARAVVPTVKFLLKEGAKVVLCTHAGRPKGEVVESMRIGNIGGCLGELLDEPVACPTDCIGDKVEEQASKAECVVLLENVRFHKGETKNDPDFAEKLAAHAKIFVNDAFGAAHRSHASTVGVTKYMDHSVAGFLMEKELDYLKGAMDSPSRPFLAMIGGAKVSTKIPVLESLLDKCDSILLGGGMIFTFYRALGMSTGASLVEEDFVDMARDLMKKAEAKGVKFLLPKDVVVADKFASDAASQLVDAKDIPDGWMGLDIGTSAVDEFKQEISQANTIVWNGPLGVFEWDAFANGTNELAKALATRTAEGGITIVGGGDCVAAVEKAGVASQISHISTGGGASLELLEGKELPGIAALDDA
ncbi:phosphoglycerate kinase [Ectocarpus siliculosus]|uniref:Phosphoglycerate kinase n=1 Tax=Ectocarpus siliculosus TaxID=2880 RepID=D8LRT8_ECTSI|nr:phosphoglycerate kinase [Ectocarpus siliculosus]|eukprot:CBN73855.1 phosphoglycerate kinase [Ectocarpus siliculosus]